MIKTSYAYAIGALVLLIAWYLSLLGSDVEQELHDVSNGTAPVVFSVVLCWLSYRVARRCPDALWSPLFWLPASSAVFFGFGPLVEVYGNETTRVSLASHRLALTAEDLSRAHLLSTSGVLLLLAGVWAHLRLYDSVWQRSLNKVQRSLPIIPPLQFALILIIAGAVLRHAIIKPTAWGMGDLVIAGVISALSPLIDLGFGILAYAASRRHGYSARILFLVLWPAHLFLTSLSFAKLEIVTALVLPALGAFIAHRNLLRLGAAMVGIALVFAAAQPYVHFGRGVILERAGSIDQAGYAERIGIVRQYIEEPTTKDSNQEVRQGWWTRLNYTGPQAFAMTAYDRGYPGSSLDGAWIQFVPRAIWPEKPIIVGPGAAFYSLVTGREPTSFLGLSIYGDLYWQFGSPGLVIGSFLIGWFFAMASWRSIQAIRARNFIMLPAVLLAMETAMLGPTKFVTNGIIGPIPIYVAYLVAATFATKLLSGRSGTAP